MFRTFSKEALISGGGWEMLGLNPGRCSCPFLQTYLVASLNKSSTVSGWFLRPLGCSSSWKVGMHRA